jgi:hypothetical protein
MKIVMVVAKIATMIIASVDTHGAQLVGINTGLGLYIVSGFGVRG